MDYEILGVEDDDEVTPGQPGPPRRPVRVLVGAVLALGALAAAVLLLGSPGEWAGDPISKAEPTVAPVPAVSSQASPNGSGFTGFQNGATAGSPTSGIGVGEVCDPYVDRTERLRVQFQLVNAGSTKLVLRDIAPFLPLPGFLRLKTVKLGGVCTAPGSEATPWTLGPGESVLVTFQLTLLQPCPKPAPVQVKARVRFTGAPLTVTIPVLPDLGAVPFTDCH